MYQWLAVHVQKTSYSDVQHVVIEGIMLGTDNIATSSTIQCYGSNHIQTDRFESMLFWFNNTTLSAIINADSMPNSSKFERRYKNDLYMLWVGWRTGTYIN